MNKVELAEKVAISARLTKKDALDIIEKVFEEIINAVKDGEEVKIAKFGSFKAKKRIARQGMNPVTKKVIDLPSQTTLTFRNSKSVKNLLND